MAVFSDVQTKTKLSSSVLKMKFMQKTREKEEAKESFNQVNANNILQQSLQESKFLIEPSYASVEFLKFGRMSFKGQNPEIEKLMSALEADRQLEQSQAKEKSDSVSDIEFAERYTTLIDTVGKKFTKKRCRSSQETDSLNTGKTANSMASPKVKTKDDALPKPRKKPKFIKPSDD